MKKKYYNKIDLIIGLSAYYNFCADFDEELNKCIITDNDRGCCFYWDSEEPIEAFFDSLKEYFGDIGAVNARYEKEVNKTDERKNKA